MLAMSSNEGKWLCYGVTNGSRIEITGLFPRPVEFARFNRSCWMETAKKGDALPDSYRAVAWPCNLWFPRSRPPFKEYCKTGQTGNMLKSCPSNRSNRHTDPQWNRGFLWVRLHSIFLFAVVFTSVVGDNGLERNFYSWLFCSYF